MVRTSYLAVACAVLFGMAGCAVIKTTDVTDASYKRHQSVAVLGWPLYTRITDQERGSSATLATNGENTRSESRLRAAELLGDPVELDEF
jgi:hypothetical protein